jgi:hypothetical protein
VLIYGKKIVSKIIVFGSFQIRKYMLGKREIIKANNNAPFSK